jgi:predicted ATPase
MEVPLPLLQAIAALPEEALHRGLTHLQAAEFLYETRLFPEQEYTFKHALTHEVAYRSLLQERRRALHTHIVEALERLAGDRLADHVERLADHAVRAEVWDKALVYCRQAGAKALERAAARAAVGCYEQALAALEHVPEHRARHEQAIDLRCDLRHARRVLGQYARILDDLRTAETLAEALDDPRRLGRVSAYMADGLIALGQYDRAIVSAQRALALAAASGDHDLPSEGIVKLLRESPING